MNIHNFAKRFTFLLFIFLLLPEIGNAETHINNNNIKSNSLWTKANSPYILDEPIGIKKNQSLRIDKGVEVKSGPYNEIDGPNSLKIEGYFSVTGAENDPVLFNDLSGIYFTWSNSNINYAIFNNSGLDFGKSTTTIKNTIIKNSFEGISAKGSRINILNSKIINNSFGINSRNVDAPVYQVRNDDLNGVGGIGNALISLNDVEGNIVNGVQNDIRINNSQIFGNTNYGIMNDTENTIDARDNWWGDASGPKNNRYSDSTGDAISGPVDYSGWKTEIEVKKCCANVLFIPGIEASRLYRDKTIASIKTTDTLWEPNTNSDVTDLYMDNQGNSIKKNIYTKDIIDSAYGVASIYDSFIKSMDKMVEDKVINKWTALPYDWRMSVSDIATDENINKIYDLASTSSNGKVIIVAHSNGGLLAKNIIKKLEGLGKSNLIEKIVYVAVPELGSPQAILAMLHGHNQSILGGLALSENTARIFSQNLPGAYGLLPSISFFKNKIIPTIVDNFSNENRTYTSYSEIKDFLLNNKFSKKISKDIDIPLTLNSNMIEGSERLHNSIDKWKAGSSTESISIFGWGTQTSESVQYERDPHCNPLLLSNCSPEVIPTMSTAGDGTVLTGSNSGNSSTTLFFNLKKIELEAKENIKHANILESKELQSKLKEIISDTEVKDNSYDKFFTKDEPVDNDKYLKLTIHSPIDIDIYDSNGLHTGAVDMIAGKQLYDYEDKIPGTFYAKYGKVKIVMVPYNDKSYNIVMKGNDTGVFSIDADIIESDKVIASTTFKEMPVIPITNIDINVPKDLNSFATGTKLNIDIDGDGSVDYVNRTDAYLKATSTKIISDKKTYLALMRKITQSLNISEDKMKLLMKRIDKMDEKFEKEHTDKPEKLNKKLSRKLFKNKKINEVERIKAIDSIDSLLDRVDLEDKISKKR